MPKIGISMPYAKRSSCNLFESFLIQRMRSPIKRLCIGVFFLHVASRWCVSCCFLHKCWRILSPLCTPPKRAPSLPNDPLTMLREIIALWAIWTLLCPFLTLTVTWLKIFLDEMIDETFIVRLSVISQSKARFDQCKITKTSSRSSEAVSRKTSLDTYFVYMWYTWLNPSGKWS